MIVKRLPSVLLLLLVLASSGTNADDRSYGSNSETGRYAEVNGIKMYYETYGAGEPLLLIHGNGQSIVDLKFQIDYFAQNYRVIVADSRGHGKTGLGTDRLTYIQMVEDYNALLEQLDVSGAYVFGWSDGGIQALLLAIRHPDKVRKMAVMGANLRPGQTAIEAWVPGLLQPLSDAIDKMIANKDTSEDWRHHRALMDLLMTQPDIPVESLRGINVPVLVIAGDKDIIRAEHTFEIFDNLPKAQMAILPGQTHWAPVTDPDSFNQLVGKFFATPFARPTSQEILEQELNPPEK